MAGLTGKTVATTYHSLLKVSTSDNQNLDTTLRDIVDGEDIASCLKLATDKATITLGGDAGDDFLVTGSSASNALVVEGESGQVGIGIAAPGEPLHVIGTDNGIRIQGTSGARGQLNFYSNAGALEGRISSTGTGDLRIGGGSTADDDIVILNGGNVGIGIATPDGTLHVHTADAGSVTPHADADDLTVENSGNGGITIFTPNANTSNIYFGSTGDSIGATITWNHDANLMSIGSHKSSAETRILAGNNNEAMRIDDAGRVGIGTDSPATALDVAGAIGGEITMTRFDDSISDGNTIGNIIWRMVDADGSTDSDNCAMIQVNAAETHDGANFGADMVFSTADNTSSTLSPRITILDSGNVGIGTDSPDFEFNVTSESSADVGITTHHNSDTDSYAPSLIFRKSGGTEGSQTAVVDNEVLGVIRALGHDGNDLGTVGAAIEFKVETGGAGAINTDDLPTDMNFKTAAGVSADDLATKMTITADGNVGIGIAAPNAPLHVEKTMADDGILANFVYQKGSGVDANDTIMILQFGNDNSYEGDPNFMVFRDSDSTMAKIYWDATNSTQFLDTSDYRVKSNIEPMVSSLANIDKLKPSSFNIKQAPKKAYGFIAHELAEVYPSMVTGDKDAVDKDGEMELQMIAYSKLIPFLVKAIQELSAKVTALENA